MLKEKYYPVLIIHVSLSLHKLYEALGLNFPRDGLNVDDDVNGRSVHFEYALDDGGKADYALFDRQGRALAVLEAKSTSVSLSQGEAQGHRYADQLSVPCIFLSNGEEVWFCDKDHDAHFRRVETVFSQDDLARRRAAKEIRRNPLDITIDRRIAGGGGRTFQIACIAISSLSD